MLPLAMRAWAPKSRTSTLRVPLRGDHLSVIRGITDDGRLHLEWLLGYAPDLAPDEGIWNSLTRVEVATVCCRDLVDLNAQLRQAEQRLRDQPSIICACSRPCGYSV